MIDRHYLLNWVIYGIDNWNEWTVIDYHQRQLIGNVMFNFHQCIKCALWISLLNDSCHLSNSSIQNVNIWVLINQDKQLFIVYSFNIAYSLTNKISFICSLSYVVIPILFVYNNESKALGSCSNCIFIILLCIDQVHYCVS